MTPIDQQLQQMQALAERHYPDDPQQKNECLVRLLEERLRTFAKFLADAFPASKKDPEPTKVRSMSLSDISRCLGHGAGPQGYQNRFDCQNCARRLAPRPSGVPLSYIEPPVEFPCPERIPVNRED